jgi:hypothetical protein
LDQLNIVQTVEAIVPQGSPELALELLKVRCQLIFHRIFPPELENRLFAFKQPNVIFQRYLESTRQGIAFPFLQPVDSHGTIIQPDASQYTGSFVPAKFPDSLETGPKKVLSEFIKTMKSRGVLVYFANSPYGIDEPPNDNWRISEQDFKKEISSLGSEVIERREDLLFPRCMFFNTALHLTKSGKEARTKILVKALRDIGLGNKH